MRVGKRVQRLDQEIKELQERWRGLEGEADARTIEQLGTTRGKDQAVTKCLRSYYCTICI
jgi:sugar-specific transcriptional regulator TrmB